MKGNFRDYFLVILLLVVSGNPAFHTQTWAAGAYAGIALLLLNFLYSELSKRFFRRLGLLILGFTIIFLIQWANLGYISTVYALGFFTKIIIGAIIFEVIGLRFAEIFFDVMVGVALCSFPFYALHYFYGEHVLSSFLIGGGIDSIGLYTFRTQSEVESSLRNSGMFWEPGAFQGFINICLLVNLYRIKPLIENRKGSLLVLVVALISTKSTTGYIIFALLFLLYVLFYAGMKKFLIPGIVALFVCLSIYLFNSLDFLGTKIEEQYISSVEMEGEFDPSRFGSFLFDMHYIRKNPLTGNGFRPITRYADHPLEREKEENGEVLGHGNGFSDFVASAGILGMLWYLGTMVQFQPKKGRAQAFVLCAIMIFLLQGEHFLIYPFFLGIAFFQFQYEHKANISRSHYVLQPEA